MTLADAQQTLATGGTQAVLAVVIGALALALVLVVRHHVAAVEAARLREEALQDKRHALAERVLKAVESLSDSVDEGRRT